MTSDLLRTCMIKNRNADLADTADFRIAEIIFIRIYLPNPFNLCCYLKMLVKIYLDCRYQILTSDKKSAISAF
jgi:hypothetical protein